ncbi:MAG: hypothetical protein A2413_06110 [Treponema sp. RIFOXYC1_FULL_61_9]|nr:MAG: hypothetical protein A2413_06110 [Treponema sp. RIFOXYC1_FULL_61_9]
MARRVYRDDVGVGEHETVLVVFVGVGYGDPVLPEKRQGLDTREDALVCRLGLLAEIVAVAGRSEGSGLNTMSGESCQQTRQGRYVIQMPVRQGNEHPGRGGPSDSREGLGEQAFGFGARVDDDERRTGVLDNIDVFPYGTYTQAMYHAQA